MKKRILLLCISVFCLLTGISNAQTPQAIPYQGVARNNSGNIIAGQNISLRLSIHDVTPAGTVVYKETHSATTNTLGLFSVSIGQGTAVTGTLSGINWGTGAKYLQVELDPAGGSSFTDMGTTQLNSVPYALYAENANVPGVAGPQGPQGPIGLTGPAGPSGNDGATGPMGPQGPAGPTGATGPQGSIGLTGPQGPAGNDGAIGPMGPQGPAGNDGATGPQGPIGLTGATGPQGPVGIDGATGATGPQGPTGNDGATGATGATGPQGPTGLLPSGATAGNTPYWNGSSWIVNNSNIYNNGANIGIGSTTPEFKLSLDVDGGIMAKGTLSSGAALNTSGSGTRMFWYPKKAAFRAGFVTNTQWDDANIGQYSFAAGGNVTASGTYSVALGNGATASGSPSVALGSNASTNSHPGSFVYGDFSTITVMGSTTDNEFRVRAAGGYAFHSDASLTAANTLVFNTGKLGVGTTSPTSKLDVEGGVAIGATYSGTTAAPPNGAIIEGKVGIGTSSPNVSAALDISSTTGSLLLPRMTTAQRDALTATQGMTIFNASSGFVQVYQNGPIGAALDQSQTAFNNANCGNTMAQSFVPSFSGTLYSVTVLYDGGAGGTATLNIRSGNGTGGGILASQAITIVSGIAGTEYEYVLTAPPSLSAGSAYTFEITGPSCTYGWRYNATSVYAPGNLFFSGAAQAGDLYFKTKMGGVYTPQWVSLTSGASGIGGLSNGSAAGNTSYWDGSSWNTGSSNIYNNGTIVGIGTTSPSTKFNVRYDLSGGGLYMTSFDNLANLNGTYNNGIAIKAGHNSYAGFASYYAGFFTPAGTIVGAIGQVSSSSVSYFTTSDERLKTNITSSKYGLNDLKQIEVKDYYYKNDDKTPQSGFIAQQLYKHYPFAVSPGGDDAQTRPWMVDYSKLTPLLVKSIQEQQEQIEALKAEIEKLKVNK